MARKCTRLKSCEEDCSSVRVTEKLARQKWYYALWRRNKNTERSGARCTQTKPEVCMSPLRHAANEGIMHSVRVTEKVPRMDHKKCSVRVTEVLTRRMQCSGRRT